MSARPRANLALQTLVLALSFIVLLVVYVVTGQRTPLAETEVSKALQPLFPVAPKITDVYRIEISEGDSKLVLMREPQPVGAKDWAYGAWHVLDRADADRALEFYRARGRAAPVANAEQALSSDAFGLFASLAPEALPSKVEAIFTALAGIKRGLVATNNPAFYGEYGLDDKRALDVRLFRATKVMVAEDPADPTSRKIPSSASAPYMAFRLGSREDEGPRYYQRGRPANKPADTDAASATSATTAAFEFGEVRVGAKDVDRAVFALDPGHYVDLRLLRQQVTADPTGRVTAPDRVAVSPNDIIQFQVDCTDPALSLLIARDLSGLEGSDADPSTVVVEKLPWVLQIPSDDPRGLPTQTPAGQDAVRGLLDRIVALRGTKYLGIDTATTARAPWVTVTLYSASHLRSQLAERKAADQNVRAQMDLRMLDMRRRNLSARRQAAKQAGNDAVVAVLDRQIADLEASRATLESALTKSAREYQALTSDRPEPPYALSIFREIDDSPAAADDDFDDPDGNAVPAQDDNAPAHNQPADNAPADNQPADNQPADNQPADNQPADNQPADNAPADNQPADNAPTDNQPADNAPAPPPATPPKPKYRYWVARAIPQQGRRPWRFEISVAAAEALLGGKSLADFKPKPKPPTPPSSPSENAPAENAPAENRPLANAPAENAPAENRPPANAPAENAPAENAPAENRPLANAPAENAPAENRPLANAPAENAPAENAPAENAPAENRPAGITPSAHAPAERPPAEHAPAENRPAENAPADNRPGS